MNIYESMRKPFQTKEEQDKLIHAYTDHSDLYNGLVRNYTDRKVKGKYDIAVCDAFYVQIFKDWRSSLARLIRLDLVKPEYQQELYAAYRYACSFEPKTKDDVLNIMDYEHIQNTMVSNGIERFRWNSIGEYSGWNHIHSNCVHYGQSKKQEIKHRIYINCDSTVTHKIMLRFIQKCNDRKSAYYFKYDSYGNRDDNLVFYCDTEHLETYISILREIMAEEKLQNHVHHPPLCAASIDGWMGYGSEPKHEKDKKVISFNQKRQFHFEKCFKEITDAWLVSHLNTSIMLNGKKVPYKDLLIYCIVEEAVTYYLNNTFNSEYTKKNKGYNLDDLQRVNLHDYLLKYVTKYFDQIISFYKDEKNYQSIQVPFFNGTLTFNKSIMEEVRKKQVQFCWDHSPRYRDLLMTRIQSTAKDSGIDPDNLACDLYVVGELGKYEPQRRTTTQTSTNTSSSNTSTQTSTAPRRRTKSGYIYRPMTDTEIEESRRKLGFK